MRHGSLPQLQSHTLARRTAQTSPAPTERQHRIRLVIALVALVLHAAAPAFADIISSSKIETCTTTGTANSTTLTACKQKLVVNLVLSEAQSAVQSVVALTKATSETGGDTVFKPVTVSVAKSETVYIYPLRYLQSVNNKPYELSLVRPGILGLIDVCTDDFGQAATCGYYFNDAGERIFDSQGFCCRCSFSDTLGITSPYTRASISCGLFSSGQNSGHCLRFDPLYYNLFEIQPERITAVIKLTIYTSDNSTEKQVLTVSPTQRVARSADGTVIARLIGSYAGFEAPYPLTAKYLLIPQQSVSPNHPQLINGRRDWMLVDKFKVDLTGRSCNKVGVSFTAFRGQPSPCSSPIGSCLDEQPKDLWTSDSLLRSRGQQGFYFLDNFSAVAGIYSFNSDLAAIVNPSSSTANISTTSTDNYALVVTPGSAPAFSLVLELDAESISYYRNVGTGAIRAVNVTDFVALTESGKLLVFVQSTSSIQAIYAVSVVNCQPAIFPVTQQSAAIDPYLTRWFTFTIQVVSLSGGNTSCSVVLQNQLGDTLDTKNVTFRTNSTTFFNGNQGGAPPDDTNRDSDSTGGGFTLGFLKAFFDWIAQAIANGYGILLLIFFIVILLALLRGCGRCCCNIGVSKSGKQRSFCVQFFHDMVQICLLPFYAAKLLVQMYRSAFSDRATQSDPDESVQETPARPNSTQRLRYRQTSPGLARDSPSSQSNAVLIESGRSSSRSATRRLSFNERPGEGPSSAGHLWAASKAKLGAFAAYLSPSRASRSASPARREEEAGNSFEMTGNALHSVAASPTRPAAQSRASGERAAVNVARGPGPSAGTRLTSTELHFLAQQNLPVYFNFQNVKPERVRQHLTNPGSRFSLLGGIRVLSFPDRPPIYLFHLNDNNLQTTAQEGDHYTALRPPRSMDAGFFTQGLTLAQASKFVSTHPRYPVINVRSEKSQSESRTSFFV